MTLTKPRLTLDAARAMAVSVVGSRLDYCNSIPYTTKIDMIQRVQIVLARVVADAPWTISSIRTFVTIYITYKLCLITWKTLHTAQPPTFLN